MMCAMVENILCSAVENALILDSNFYGSNNNSNNSIKKQIFSSAMPLQVPYVVLPETSSNELFYGHYT
jgi:hypothetical protein